MRDCVLLPGCDALVRHAELIFAGVAALAHSYGEIMLVGLVVRKVLLLPEIVGYAIYCYGNQCLAAFYSLRHHYCPELVAYLQRNGSGHGRITHGPDFSCPQVDDGPAGGVCDHYLLLRRRPFPVSESQSLVQTHFHAGHPVPEAEPDGRGGGSNVRGLPPEEVAGLITSRLAVFRRLSLVALQLE